DDALVADLRAVQDDGAHADETLIAHHARVHDRAVAHGDVLADLRAVVIREMHHRVVLNVRTAADHDGVDVAPEHGAIPDAALVPQRDVPDDRRRSGHEDVAADPRLASKV